MQKNLMGHGDNRKLRGVEKVEGDDDRRESDDDDTDTRRRQTTNVTYKPRVYKWRLERKR
jgi:U3 small nucleolar RNA-associated protein 11